MNQTSDKHINQFCFCLQIPLKQLNKVQSFYTKQIIQKQVRVRLHFLHCHPKTLWDLIFRREFSHESACLLFN